MTEGINPYQPPDSNVFVANTIRLSYPIMGCIISIHAVRFFAFG